jgi:16S rRNA (adenine1518-N6/adenine1519-N6)-dimethyltransferase
MTTRRYGQHFLTDGKIVERIVEASGIGKEDAVLEIGPGRGVLTRALAARAGKVLAVEIDRRLHAELLAVGLPPNVALKLGDALSMTDADIRDALGTPYALVSNLPYEITSATLLKFLTASPPPKVIILMLQLEVGERIVAGPGAMNRLAALCGYYSDVKLLFRVPPGAFSPPPKVRSCVVKLIPRAQLPLAPDAQKLFFRLIEAAFAQKRKSLSNSLSSFCGNEAKARLAEAGIDPAARPQDIPLERWITLALKMC